MNGGIIYGNTSSCNGGGVFVSMDGIFTKTGGTVYGYTIGDSNSNVVKNDDGNILHN